MFRASAFAITSASLLLFTPHAVAAQYSFVNIADTRGPFESFRLEMPQAVSDTGSVAFLGYQGGVVGAYVGDGASTISIVPDISPPPGFGFFGIPAPALSETGVSVWSSSRGCCPFPEYKVQLYEASGTQTIAEATNSATSLHLLWGLDVNDGGSVAIASYTFTIGSIGSEQWSITRWFDGTSTTVLETTEGFRGVDAIRINELGDVAFHGDKHGGEYAYYRTDGTTLTIIADSSGPLNLQPKPSSYNEMAVNDSGAVAFVDSLDIGGEGLFVGNGGPLTTVAVADPSTPFYFIDDDIDINNEGTVAFFAGLWDGRNGMFTGADPVSDKVIAQGDLLFGQFVEGLGRPHLNERGDIAFWYEVRDPRDPSGYRTGIALALKESPLPGDYNGDGVVNGADLTNWKTGFGTTGNAVHSLGDADGDLDVDGADFLGWQRQLGSGAPVAATAAVPEPATLLFLVAVVLAMCVRPRVAVS